MYCKCESPKTVISQAGGKSFKICTKSQGGCGCEITEQKVLMGTNATITINGVTMSGTLEMGAFEAPPIPISTNACGSIPKSPQFKVGDVVVHQSQLTRLMTIQIIGVSSIESIYHDVQYQRLICPVNELSLAKLNGFGIGDKVRFKKDPMEMEIIELDFNGKSAKCTWTNASTKQPVDFYFETTYLEHIK